MKYSFISVVLAFVYIGVFSAIFLHFSITSIWESQAHVELNFNEKKDMEAVSGNEYFTKKLDYKSNFIKRLDLSKFQYSGKCEKLFTDYSNNDENLLIFSID